MLQSPHFSLAKNLVPEAALGKQDHVHVAVHSFHQFHHEAAAADGVGLVLQRQIDVGRIVENARLRERPEDNDALARNQIPESLAQSRTDFFTRLKTSLPASGIAFLQEGHRAEASLMQNAPGVARELRPKGVVL